MASMQKATYLGLKAGNPQVIVGTIPFAGRTPVTLADYHANQAWPYFDTFNFHVYRDFDEWPATCAPFRDVSAGRPMWITEMNVPIPWPGMQRFRPPTAGDEAAQAERVAKLYAVALHEGTAAAFYFVLPHYIERNMEHGLLRADLTPRPAYVALAAVGRLLADAHPLGKLRTDHPRLRGFIFRARPDGTDASSLWPGPPTERKRWSCRIAHRDLRRAGPLAADIGHRRIVDRSGDHGFWPRFGQAPNGAAARGPATTRRQAVAGRFTGCRAEAAHRMAGVGLHRPAGRV